MRRLAVRRFAAVVVLVLYTVFLIWHATRPSPEVRWMEMYWDKAIHAAAFFVLGALALWAAGYPRLSARKCARRGFWVGLYAFAVGGAIELLQIGAPGRSCERADLVADLVGTAGAVLVMVSIIRRQERLQRAAHP